jgi:hypothetical protein
MANNPLQQYFRQPKIYIKLPSQGTYSQPGTFTADVTNLPVYGMTGMDEIIMKTPDSLLTGESIVQVIKSCCPGIANPWELTVLDTDLIFSAIRIATFGTQMGVTHRCPHCDTENAYDVDLTKVIEHFSKCEYDNKIVLKDLVIKTQPLSYKQSTEFALRNFALQQQLAQAEQMENKEEQQKVINRLFQDLANMQNDLFWYSIESVEVGNTVVNEREYIREWILNCDRDIFDKIKEQIEKNKEAWVAPMYTVICENTECAAENKIRIELDQSNFFVKA